jgi:outer membrane receptor protein involved in Fe transport
MTNQPTKFVRAAVAALACVLGLLLTSAASAAGATKSFDIPAGEALPALKQFAAQSGEQLLYSAEAVQGVTTNPVKGVLTARAALDQMVSGTNLRVIADEKNGALSLVRAPGPNAPRVAQEEAATRRNQGKFENGTLVLDEMEVQGRRAKPFADGNMDFARSIGDVQPYYVVDSVAIERSGATNLDDLLRLKVTMNTQSQSADQGIYLGGSSQSGVNLRGLGSANTLILVNGRRITAGNGYNGNGSEDNIYGIPLGAIERVEVLPTSASAIYGANAVGGVVNIVLKRNFSGGEVRTTYQNTVKSDAPKRSVDLTYGQILNGGKTRLMLTASYSDSKALQVRDRPFLYDYYFRRFVNEGVTTFNIPVRSLPTITSQSGGNLQLKPQFGGTALGFPITYVPYGTTPTTPLATLANSLVANAGKIAPDNADFADNPTGGAADLGQAPTLKAFGLSLQQEVTKRIEFNLDYSYSESLTKWNNQPFSSSRLSLGASSPLNPFTTGIVVTAPFEATLPNVTSAKTQRFAAGFLVKLPHDWTAQVDYYLNKGTNHTLTRDPLATSALDATIAAGQLNPLVDTSVYRLNLTPFSGTADWRGTGDSSELTVRASGKLWHLPGGEPYLTVAVQDRDVGYDSGRYIQKFPSTVPNLDTDLDTEYDFATVTRSQRAKSAYVETLVPLISAENKVKLINELNLQFAFRVEDFTVNLDPAVAKPAYRSSNMTTGLSYRPVKGVMLRASYGEAFKSPDYAQLVGRPAPFNFPVTDPRRGNTRYVTKIYFGGNPDLKPELSESWNAGLVFEPTSAALKGLRLDLEYYRIRQFDKIGTVAFNVWLANEALVPGLITRGPLPAGDPYPVGPITSIDGRYRNFLYAVNEGFDLSLRYRRQTDRWGAFDLSFTGTLPMHNLSKINLLTPEVDYLGYTGLGAPKFNGNLSATWDYKQWTLSWTTRYVDRLKIPAPPVTTFTSYVVTQGGNFVPSQAYSDAFVTYRFDHRGDTEQGWRTSFTNGLEIQAGIVNVFNKVPPFDSASGPLAGYSTWGNIRLQEYRLSVKKTF